MIPDTGKLPIVMVPCKYISADFHKALDDDYGRRLKDETEQGHVTYTIRFEGRQTPRWWEKLARLLFDRS